MAVAALFLLLWGGCGAGKPSSTTFTGATMGTTYHVTIAAALSDEESAAAVEAVGAALEKVDSHMSTYKADSELSRLNAAPGGKPVSLSPATFDVIRTALAIGAEAEGAFDITVGPLVNAWGFGPTAMEEAPTDAELAALLALTGLDKVSLDAEERTVTKAADGVYLDLSAIAKGYAVDRVADTLAELGHKNFMVEVGGEVRTAGLNAAGVPWRIAVEKPVDSQRVLQEVLALSNVSLATSGNYRNFYMADGKRVSHTFNPRTGRPVDHGLASASVIHPECAMADAYATTLMVLGPEEGRAFAEAHGLAVMLIGHPKGDTGDFVVWQTPSFAEYVAAQ